MINYNLSSSSATGEYKQNGKLNSLVNAYLNRDKVILSRSLTRFSNHYQTKKRKF